MRSLHGAMQQWRRSDRSVARVEGLELRILLSGSTGVNLPSPYQATDVGSVGVTGSSSFSNGVFTVMGAGDDAAFGATDANQFAYQTLSGNGTIIAHVDNMGGPGASPPLAGLVLRSSLDPTAEAVFIAERDPSVVIVNSRTSTGGTGTNLTISNAANPYWVELVRNGNVITAEDSADGVNFTTIAMTTLTNLPNNVLVGMAVGAQTNGSLATATFDHVTVTPANAGPSATLSAPPITSVQTGAYGFTVTYASSAGVNASSIGAGNVIVTGPGGFSQVAAVTNPPGANAQSITAMYSLNPPPVTPGVYTVTLAPNQVLDLNGNAATGQVLGTFTVGPEPSVTGTVTNAATGLGIAGQRVFFDLNHDGKFEANEPWASTDANGNYVLGQAGPATYRVTEELKAGQTYASPASGFHDVAVVLGITATGTNFTDNVSSVSTLPDLSAAFSGKPPKTLTAGKHAAVAIAVTNTGAAVAKGTFSISLSSSATTTADSTAPVLFTFSNRKLNLKHNGKRVFHLSFLVPTLTTTGSRFLTATVNSTGSIAESNSNNNVAISTTPTTFS